MGLEPGTFSQGENIFDIRLISMFGHCLSAWQVVPIVYILTGVAVTMAGKIIYRNYQVSGR